MLRPFLEELSGEDAMYILSLPSLGFTEYEVKALICLAGGIKTPQEVWMAAGIPRTKAYDVLKSLVKKGWVVESEGRPLEYSLRDDALRRVVSKVEGSVHTVLFALRDLERVRQKGIRSVVEGDVAGILKGMGFKVKPAKAGRPYLVALSPQGFKVVLIIPEEGLLTGDGLEKILSFRDREEAWLAVILASQEDVSKVEELGAKGVVAVEYRKGRLSDLLFEVFREAEEAVRSFRDKVRQHHDLFAEATSLIPESLRKTGLLKALLAEAPSEVQVGFSKRVRELEEALLIDEFRLKFLEKSWGTIEAEVGKHFPKRSFVEAEIWIEELALLVERLQNRAKSIAAMSAELKGLVDRRRELGFTPISIQCPEAPSDDSVVGQKDLIRSLEKFVWSSKSLGGSSLGVLLGDHGGGKTLFARYFTGRINRGNFGSVVAAYTFVSESFLESYNDFTVTLSLALATSKAKVEWTEYLTREKTLLDALRGFSRGVENLQIDHGIFHIYWVIDDFEKLFKIPAEKRNTFMSEFRALLSTQGDNPFTILLTLTPEAYELLSKEYPEIARRIPPSSIFRIPPLRLEDLKELATRSLHGLEEERQLRLLRPSEEVYEALLEMSKGNPRDAINLLNEALYIASKTGRSVNKDLLKSLPKI